MSPPVRENQWQKGGEGSEQDQRYYQGGGGGGAEKGGGGERVCASLTTNAHCTEIEASPKMTGIHTSSKKTVSLHRVAVTPGPVTGALAQTKAFSKCCDDCRRRV